MSDECPCPAAGRAAALPTAYDVTEIAVTVIPAHTPVVVQTRSLTSSLMRRRMQRTAKHICCSLALFSPVLLLLVLDEPHPMSMIMDVVLPIIGSFVFLFIAAAILTYGFR